MSFAMYAATKFGVKEARSLDAWAASARAMRNRAYLQQRVICARVHWHLPASAVPPAGGCVADSNCMMTIDNATLMEAPSH